MSIVLAFPSESNRELHGLFVAIVFGLSSKLRIFVPANRETPMSPKLAFLMAFRELRFDGRFFSVAVLFDAKKLGEELLSPLSIK
jgi:hypothetical protein